MSNKIIKKVAACGLSAVMAFGLVAVTEAPKTANVPDGHLRPHAGQAPVGADREDRSELLFPRPDPGSTSAPAK
mgnify:CR=1 FL=1